MVGPREVEKARKDKAEVGETRIREDGTATPSAVEKEEGMEVMGVDLEERAKDKARACFGLTA